MNQVITYKCPNCGGDLRFDPAIQDFHCGYCQSRFAEQELTAQPLPEQTAAESLISGYSCPSCGAEVVTEATTAATFCFYCHNPVTISARLAGDFQPDQIIPFQINREQATERFLAWVRKKRYVPKNFFSAEQLEKISGVYFPYWLVDAELRGRFSGRGERVRTWSQGDYRYTETSYFQVEREADIQFASLIKKALRKAENRLVESVQPFDDRARQPFKASYLAGFQAEKRDIERTELNEEVGQELLGYADTLLRETAKNQYSRLDAGQPDLQWRSYQWHYCLLPVWVLTYRQGQSEKIYYYAMNGQTGQVNGELPVDKGKLLRHALLAGGAVLLFCCLLGIGRYLL